MNLKQKILDDFKIAFKEKNAEKKTVLSMLKSEISNQEIELGKKQEGLDDEEVIQVISKLIKQRKDSAEQYKSGGRDDLAQKEEFEVQVLLPYLPAQLSDEEIENQVKEIAQQIGAENKSDMGKLMGASMAKLKGKADGSRVKVVVEKILS